MSDPRPDKDTPSPSTGIVIPAAAMAAARRKRQPKGSTPPRNVFLPPEFPPGVAPRGEHALAQDSAVGEVYAWAGNQYLTSSFAEGIGFFGYAYLAELAQRAEYRVLSETLAEEMTREWIELRSASEDEGKADKIKKIDEELDRLKVREAFRTTAVNDGFFGRSHLYLDTGATDDEEELRTSIGDGRDGTSKNKVSRDKPLVAVRTVEPMWAYPLRYNATNPLAPDWYRPSAWLVFSKEVHRTRLLRFVSREVSDILKPAYAFGGLALSQMAKPYVDNWLRTRQSVSDLVASFAVPVLKTVLDTLLQGDMGTKLTTRVDFFNQLRDNHGAMVIDKVTEDFTTVATPLGGLDHLQAQAQEHLALPARIPLVKLWGITPSGLNTSTDGEVRTFYDRVHAVQGLLFKDHLTTIVGLVQLSLFGEVDPDITFVFRPLWQLDETAQVANEKTKADTHDTYAAIGAVSGAEVRRALTEDPESLYAGLSLDPDEVPEPPAVGGGGFGEEGGAPGEEGNDAEDLDPERLARYRAIFATDEADWKEGKHPRDAEGQFASAPSGGAPKGNALRSLLVERGYTKTGPVLGGNVHHTHPSGAKVIRKQNGHWISYAPGQEPRAGFGASELRQLFKGSPHLKAMPVAPSMPAKLAFGALNLGAMKQVGPQLGSNPGGTYEAPDGQRYYVKLAQTRDHARNELTSAKLYQLAGVPTFDYHEVVDPATGKAGVASTFQQLDAKNVSELTSSQRKEARKQLVVHAWLANWDAVGLGGDNLGVVNGRVTPLDLGGSLLYRAQGAPKGGAFNDTPTELTALRDPQKNPSAAALFKDATPEELAAGAKKLSGITNAQILDATQGAPGTPHDRMMLANTLIKRRDALVKETTTPPKPSPPSHSDLRAHAPAPTLEQSSALSAYIGVAYQNINDCLRHLDDCSHLNQVKHLEQYLDKAALPQDVTLYRGIKHEAGNKLGNTIQHALNKGVQPTLRERGFMSTSTSPGTAEGFSSQYRFEITAPKGTRAAALDNSSEKEVLVQRGTRMRITAYDESKKVFHVVLEQDH